MKKFLIINGPNLNMLGTREPEIYGSLDLSEIQKYTEKNLKSSHPNTKLDWFQSNIEGEIVEKIQSCVKSDYEALIINPAAYSHTSVAILDAMKLLEIPIVEVHISNTHAREEFREKRLCAKQSTIILEGLGKKAYYVALLSQLID